MQDILLGCKSQLLWALWNSLFISSWYEYVFYSGVTPTTEHRLPPQQMDKERLFDRQASSQADTTLPFLQALAESKMQDPNVKTFLDYIERYSRNHHFLSPIEFPLNHPVEEVAR